MQTEYVIWGIAPNETEENLLLAEPGGHPLTCLDTAKRYMHILETRKGCTACRIQTIDGSVPNFTAAIATR